MTKKEQGDQGVKIHARQVHHEVGGKKRSFSFKPDEICFGEKAALALKLKIGKPVIENKKESK